MKADYRVLEPDPTERRLGDLIFDYSFQHTE